MADSNGQVEKDGKVEGSLSEFSENHSDKDKTSSKTDEEGHAAIDQTENEIAEEEKSSDKIIGEESPNHLPELCSTLVNEDGEKEGIAKPEGVDQDFPNSSHGEDEGGGKKESKENITGVEVQKDVCNVKENDLNVTPDDSEVDIKVEEHENEEPKADCKDEEYFEVEGDGNVENECEEDSGDEDDGDYKAGDHDADCEDEEFGDEEDGECNVEDDVEGEEESDDNYVEEERQQGDGEECAPESAVIEKELDFDEDRRNPQYIPKKGIFYEHDDRNVEELKEKEAEPARDHKKKLWLDEGRWGHDRFRLEEQYPKSKHELIATYGYDIRNEDGPPRARRRRRYGRGPTKYERDWEDVTAYSRDKLRGAPRGVSRGRRPGGPPFRGAQRFRGQGRKEYNHQEPSNEHHDENDQENESFGPETKEREISSVPIINNKEFPALPIKESPPPTDVFTENRPFFQKSSSETPESASVRTLTFENSNLSGRNSIERDVLPPRRGKTAPFGNQPSDNYVRGSRRPAPRGGRTAGRGESIRRGRGNNMRHISPRFLENKVNNLKMNMDSLTIDDSSNVGNSMNLDDVGPLENCGVNNVASDGDLPSMALKGAGDSTGRPKRYSSLRQRSLPETNSYPSTQQAVPTQHGQYYEAGYQPALYAATDSGVSPSNPQSQSATSPPLLNPSAYQSFAATPYTDSYGIRMPVNQPPPRLFPQATVPAAQPILAAPPPPCLPPPNANLINFAPPPPSSGYPQFTYQQFAQAAPAPPPPALYAATDSGVSPSNPQSQSATSPPLLNPSAYQSFAATPYTDSYGIRMPVNQPPPRLFPQATVPAAQPILAAPPPPCLPPPNANLINFAPPPPSSGYPQFTYQQFAQAAPAPPPAPPNEMYQTGITYYYPHTQATSIRPTVQKRPKAAIPILPPPDRENKRKEKESSSHKPPSDAVIGEMPSLRTESSSQSQALPSVGVES